MERIVNELWRKALEASKTHSAGDSAGERQIKLGKEKFAETVTLQELAEQRPGRARIEEGGQRGVRWEAGCTGAIAGTVRL